MSYKTKPAINLYKYENNTFKLQAIIDDFQECSFEHNLYEAGTFTISINYNIPNALKFARGLFVQFGNSYNFGEIISISDAIGEDGEGSQIRTITGYDARYLLKRRVIKNMNSNGLWAMTGKGELVLRTLINDQCGTNAETKRRLPIINTIPTSENAIGNTYSVSESFSNLYEVCKTIATQSEIGWRIEFDGTNLNLVCYSGEDRSQTVRFDTDYESLAEGEFTDSSDAFSNAIYVGGKGQNDDRDIYEGEDAIGGNSPSGLDRFECWDNQSSMTTESEYEAEALSMLSQYGQTITLSGKGLAKCPYVFQEQYNVGDMITVAFSGKSAVVQILSVTEHWVWNEYDMEFNFGKPQPGLDSQLQLILKQIQKASNKTNSKDSVRWYTIPTDTSMPASDVTYTTIGFIGDVGSDGKTFTLYRDASGTGSKTYHVYFKQLAGSGKLTLTTGVSGASNLVMNSGTYVAIIYVDENGNVTTQGATPTDVIASGNTQPATSSGVAQAISSAVGSPNVSNATGTLAIEHGGTGQTTAGNASNALLSGLPDWTADPTDTTKLIRRDTGGGASFGQVTFLTVWNYIKSKIQNVGSLIIGIASTIGTKLKLKGMTYGTNTYTDNNPKIVFENTDASQNVSLTFTDYDAVQSPASLTLNGNQGEEYFIAPNIKATTRFYGALTGNVTGNASGSSGSCTGNSATSSKVVGTYTGSGGQQNPRYVGKTRVCFNMMNTTVNGNSQYKDWLMMDCYSGFDVGGTVALGINRQSLGAYIMRANAGTSPDRPTSWADSAELIHTKNLLNILYPVGAIYITLSSADFSNFLGGTWVKINDGSFIRASGGNAGTVGQVQAEGLPNITGSIKGTGYSIGTNNGATNSGALKGEEFNMKAASGTSSNASYMSKISFNATDGNSTTPDGASSGKIYGNSSHVTPRNIAVYMWKRTA